MRQVAAAAAADADVIGLYACRLADGRPAGRSVGV